MKLDFDLCDPAFAADCVAGRGTGDEWRILEARFTSADHPETDPRSGLFHLPGALRIHPSYLEAGSDTSRFYPNYTCPEDGNLLPDAELARALDRIGIGPDSRVLVYGCEPDGTMAAARVAWGLLYAGVATVRLLDGGIDAWLAAGGTTGDGIETAAERAERASSESVAPGRWDPRSELVADLEEVREISARYAAAVSDGAIDGSDPPANGSGERAPSRLVDVRTLGEWDGSCPEHYPFFSVAGHIPGAIHQGDWDTLVDRETHSIATRLESVAQRWRELGILDASVESGEVELVFCCGTGWRSSISFLIATLLGLRARNFDSGFYGWSWNENPVMPALPRCG